MPEPSAIAPYLEEMHQNRWYTNFGPLAQRFEAAIADFMAETGSPGMHTGTFSSATTGLELMLRAMQLPKGGKVLIPALTFPATALAIMNAGLEPVFGDVDPFSWELTAKMADTAHSHSPLAAVMPVSAFGKPVETDQWLDFQQANSVPVLIDAAAVLGQQPVPSGLSAVFSLHATKPFGVGEGGLVVTSDIELLTRAKSLSNFGFVAGMTGVVQQAGTNAKFGEYYAAVGLAQIARWREVIEKRRRVAALYMDHIAPLCNRIRLQSGIENFVPAVFPIFAPGKANEIQAAMTAVGIQTRKWYLPLLYKHPALAHLQFAVPGEEASVAACNELADGLIGLPFHAFLREDDIKKICAVLARIV